MIILLAVSALTGLAMLAKSLLIGTNAPIISDTCKHLYIYCQQIMGYRCIFAKNSELFTTNCVIFN